MQTETQSQTLLTAASLPSAEITPPNADTSRSRTAGRPKRGKKEMTPAELSAWKAERDRHLARYRAAKEYAEANKDDILKQIAAATAGFDKPISIGSFVFVLQQLNEQHLDGVPYLHTRTFKEWLAIGRSVRKGETAKLISFTWVGNSDSEELQSADEHKKEKRYPKLTHLFHISQTDPLPEKSSSSSSPSN